VIDWDSLLWGKVFTMAASISGHSRLGNLRRSLERFGRGLSWRSVEPVEERLALASVSQARMYLVTPAIVIASVAASWWLFPEQEGTDRLGLFYGTASIVLMAWTFVLATRARVLELLFGGFDRLHIWHRWFGIASLVFLLLHSGAENNVQNGVVPFGRGIEDTALSLAEVAQTLLIILIVVSILRVLPYRIWRFSHLLIFVPFAFSAFHVVTAEQPFEQFSFGAIWLWGWSAIGLVAFLYRLLVVDTGFFDTRATLTFHRVVNQTVEINLARRDGSAWNRIHPGQFVFLRWGGWWREAHPFSVVSTTDDLHDLGVRFRATGDGTTRAKSLGVGDRVLVSAPFGHLDLGRPSDRVVWIAGGSGVTPFVRSPEFLSRFDQPPTLIFFFRGQGSAIELDYLREVAGRGLLTLVEVDTSLEQGRPKDVIERSVERDVHVAVCGPRPLVLSVLKRAKQAKARKVSFELYDYRSPFGPDLNPILRALLTFILPEALIRQMGWLFEGNGDSRGGSELDLEPTTSLPTNRVSASE
jgi:predicted ferric reductase